MVDQDHRRKRNSTPYPNPNITLISFFVSRLKDINIETRELTFCIKKKKEKKIKEKSKRLIALEKKNTSLVSLSRVKDVTLNNQ